jgi:suppressor of fused-like protein
MSDSVPGWDAIDKALWPIYRDLEPLHVGTVVRYCMGGKDPLDGISAYKVLHPRPHWHFVTYGLSELYEKESENLEVSGWGIELTFRLACPADEEKPGWWPFNFLQNLARYVFDTGNVFAVRHHMTLNGPIAQGAETAIEAIAFTTDATLSELIDTPHGELRFLQVVGVTSDELDLMRSWDTLRFLDVLAEENPFLITDLERPSLLADPVQAQRIRKLAAQDGSSMEQLMTNLVNWTLGGRKRGRENLELVIGAMVVDDLKMMLAGRIAFGREFTVVSPERQLALHPAQQSAWRIDRETLHIQVSPELRGELEATLQPVAGVYECPTLPGLVFKVVPTNIKDGDGKVVRKMG